MSDIERLTDSEMVAAYVAGDRGVFAAIYDRYASRIFSYTLTMLRDRSDAADAAYVTFMTAARRMGELDDPAELRPWLFAIARETTHSLAREQARTNAGEEPSGAAGGDGDLAKGPRGAELQELVWAAADGLGERDQQLLALHLTEGLEGDDLARAMGVETSHIQMMVSRMKNRVEKALGTLLLARLGSEDCDEFQTMIGSGDRALSREVRSRVNQHVDGCEICQQRRALLLQPANVLPGIMVVPAPAALRPRVLDKVDRGDLVAAPPTSRSRRIASPEWTMLGVFALVALVVGLIGFAVSAQFEPIDPPASVSGSVPPPAAAGTTTSTMAPGPTTTRAGQATTSSTVADEPAAVEVSTESIDFGEEGIAAQFDLRNTGGRPGQWRLASSTDAIAPSAGEGELAGGETATIDLSLDREQIEEGEISETVTITWDDGELVVTITGTHEANPVIHNPQAAPSSVEVSGDGECQNTQTTISARIRDNSPLESVVVQWSPDGGGQEETEMVPVGNDVFEAVIGPFTTAQSTSVRIVAFDDRGNAGGATAPITVVDCP